MVQSKTKRHTLKWPKDKWLLKYKLLKVSPGLSSTKVCQNILFLWPRFNHLSSKAYKIILLWQKRQEILKMNFTQFLVLIQMISAMRLTKRFLPITAQLPEFPTGRNSGKIHNMHGHRDVDHHILSPASMWPVSGYCGIT